MLLPPEWVRAVDRDDLLDRLDERREVERPPPGDLLRPRVDRSPRPAGGVTTGVGGAGPRDRPFEHPACARAAMNNFIRDFSVHSSRRIKAA